MASLITGVSIVCSTVCSGADQRKYQSSAWLAFVRRIHWRLMNSPHKRPVTRKMFPFDDVIMSVSCTHVLNGAYYEYFPYCNFLTLLHFVSHNQFNSSKAKSHGFKISRGLAVIHLITCIETMFLSRVTKFALCVSSNACLSSNQNSLAVNTWKPRQNSRHFANIFKCIFLNENVWISIKI